MEITKLCLIAEPQDDFIPSNFCFYDNFTNWALYLILKQSPGQIISLPSEFFKTNSSIHIWISSQAAGFVTTNYFEELLNETRKLTEW